MTIRPLLASIGAAALLAAHPAIAALVTIYDVSIDTTSIAAQSGFLDLQFNPGTATALAATATVSGFLAGGTLGSPTVDGSVTGALPGTLVFGNGTPFNAVLQPLTPFGTAFSFRVSFDGAFASASTGVGTTFSLGVLGPDPDYPPLLGANPDGRSLLFELGPGNITYTTFDASIGVTPVPEPAAWMLVVGGLALLALIARRRAT
jgi:MYXO-CTERM domain-containing protein